MNKWIIGAAVLLSAGIILADEIIVDHASGRSPAVGPIQFVSSGTGTNTVLKVNSVQSTNVSSTVINATTVNCTTLKAGTQTAFTGVITNKMDNYTNLVAVYSGVITNVTLIGALP